ncbi:hypothetical protein O1611_g2624 [Lasiodiplodia mahajangana]|uniref:Uncharacterized protein n=1 Tax=Lasiodiplodia mahajangana TaxID=1108764 RepID=A0ACC2JUI7_9PEZI|nr:hypothetical protein O1611_g2624 [Lasiodiplodia mahajangana]
MSTGLQANQGHNSENDDQPRFILDTDNLVHENHPELGGMSIALLRSNFHDALDMARPEPDEEWTDEVKRSMGNGEHGVWRGSRFAVEGAA